MELEAGVQTIFGLPTAFQYLFTIYLLNLTHRGNNSQTISEQMHINRIRKFSTRDNLMHKKVVFA